MMAFEADVVINQPKVLIATSMPIPCSGNGVPLTCASIVERFYGYDDAESMLFTPYFKMPLRKELHIVETRPWFLKGIPFRAMRKQFKALHERTYERALLTGQKKYENTIAYVWPDASVEHLARLRKSGVRIAREMINCHRGTARPILEAEYLRLNLRPAHTITEASIEAEIEALSLCDIIFCSNTEVEKSIVENRADQRKIRKTSFGWDPSRFAHKNRAIAKGDGPTFIFVGYICIRKGAHLLLSYWAKSGIRGRLVLVGKMERAVAVLCAEQLNRQDVTVVDYTNDVCGYYNSADVFVFPTLEEGGPQVTYEAAGCGLPLITSPMGAARIGQDRETGFVVDPFSEDGWIAAMRGLADHYELRRQMGETACNRASVFAWPVVSHQRLEHLMQLAVSADT